MSQRGHAAKQAAETIRREKIAKLDAMSKPFADALAFEAQTLARVRMQLDQIFEMFTKERDPAKLDRLAAAQSRLSEQERILAGRPMPGSLKPSSTKAKPKLAQVQMTEVQPDVSSPQVHHIEGKPEQGLEPGSSTGSCTTT